jgi:16S rRNA (guanine966-N2)-methyltransferase
MAEGGRVIAGHAASIRLEAAASATRPLSDRVKQALFASLESDGVFGAQASFLDLFAGTGAGGIEALSRGASRAVFVEHDSAACAIIERNLERTGVSGGRVRRADALAFLRGDPTDAGAPFDAALLDPPYDAPLLVPALTLLGEPRGWLSRGAIVVAKHFWRAEPAARFGALNVFRRRRFGETMLTFYREER